MPRSMAPPPSGEFAITVTKGFGKIPTTKVEFIGEPNRPATVKVTERSGAQNQNVLTKTGSIQATDVNELLDLVRQLEGFPTSPNEDIYGFDAQLMLSTFEIQWNNGEDIEGAEAPTNPTEENKQTFKNVIDSIQSLARQQAK